MTKLEWMLVVIMLAGFLFAAVARFNLHRYLQPKRILLSADRQYAQMQFKNTTPEVILDNGIHQLLKYFIVGMIIFFGSSVTLVDSGVLKPLVTLFIGDN